MTIIVSIVMFCTPILSILIVSITNKHESEDTK